MIRRVPAWLLMAVLLLISAPPIIAIIIISLQSGTLSAHAVWTLDNYREVLGQMQLGGPFPNTILFAGGASAIALIFGGTLAFIVERTNTPLRGLSYVMAIGSIATPGAVYAIAWSLTFSRMGMVNSALRWACGLVGASCEPVQINNLAGMIWIEGMSWIPLAFLLLAGPIRSMDSSLEESARAAGARPIQVFMHITVPLLLPAIVSVLLLTFVRAIESFAIPAIIGTPGHVSVVTTEIFAAASIHMPPEYGLGGAYGTVLIVIVAAFLFLYSRITASSARFAMISGKGFKVRTLALGKTRYVLSLVIILYFVVLIGAPLLVLMLASLQRFYSGFELSNPSLIQYQRLIGYSQIGQSIGDSIIVGAMAAVTIMFLSFLAAWISVRGEGRIRAVADFLVSLPLVMPGIVVGLALLQVYVNAPLPIYGTLFALAMAGVTRFLPFGFRYAHAGILQLHKELEEAALMSGASRRQMLTRIVLPLVALPLTAGFLYVFLISARELEASILLVTGSTPMVAPVLVALFENGSIPQVAAFSCVIITVLGAIAYLFYALTRRYGLRPG